MTGGDKNFAGIMQLVGHLLQHPKSNEKILKSIKDAVKADEKALTEENSDVLKAMLQKVSLGDNSTDFNRLTYKEAKILTGEELIEVFNSIFGSACDITYSGTLESHEVENVVRKSFPIERSKAAYVDYSSDVIGYDIASQRREGYKTDKNTGKTELYQATSMEDIRKFYESNIKNNTSHRVLGIIGNKKKLNLKELQKYGQVIFLKEKDLFRKERDL